MDRAFFSKLHQKHLSSEAYILGIISQQLPSPGALSTSSSNSTVTNNEKMAMISNSTRIILAQQAADVIASLAAINCTFTSSAWSIVCPNWNPLL